jgi:TetR/AcrR family transcriptional regulator, repressor for uid operon
LILSSELRIIVAMLSMADILQAGPEPGEDATVDRIAAAALDQFAQYGIRRSTIDDVAKRAGVSRVTVFRRFTNKERLVEFVVAREIRRGMEELDRAWDGGGTLEDRLVHGFSFVMEFTRGHPLFGRLLHSEPDYVLPLVTVDGGPALALYRLLIAHRLDAEVRAGRARPGDVEAKAEVIARLAMSLVLTPAGVIDLDDEGSVRAFVRLALLPMLQPNDGKGQAG